MKIEYPRSEKWILLIAFMALLLGCASKSGMIVVHIENKPDYIPFLKIGHRIVLDIGSKYMFGAPFEKRDVYDKYTESLAFVDLKKPGKYFVDFYIDENGSTKNLKDTVSRFESCEVVYYLAPKGKPYSDKGPVFFENDSLFIYKNWDRDCEQ